RRLAVVRREQLDAVLFQLLDRLLDKGADVGFVVDYQHLGRHLRSSSRVVSRRQLRPVRSYTTTGCWRPFTCTGGRGGAVTWAATSRYVASDRRMRPGSAMLSRRCARFTVSPMAV